MIEIPDIPESGGTKDYTELDNKPKINGVELNGDLTPAELGLSGAGGFGLSILDNYDIELIAQAYSIDQENLPKRIDITQKDDGTPFEYDGVIVWTDAKDSVSYTVLRVNNDRLLNLPMSHGDKSSMNLYITDGNSMYLHAFKQDPQFMLKQSRYDVNQNFFPNEKMQALPKKFTSVSFGAYFELSAITFYKVWGLKKK